MTHNKYISQGEERPYKKSARLNLPEHRLVSLPKNRTFKKTPYYTARQHTFGLSAQVVVKRESGYAAPALQEELSAVPALQIILFKKFNFSKALDLVFCHC